MKRRKTFHLWAMLSLFMACFPLTAAAQDTYFSLQKYVTGPASTLRIWIAALNTTTGEATISGMDTAQPTTPFTFSWGDGQDASGFFQQHHTYQDLTRNYTVKITAHYAGGATDDAEVMVLFVPPEVNPQTLPPTLAVTIPNHPVTLGSHVSGFTPPSNLTFFDDTFFAVVPRATAEYVLSAAATVEEDFVNGNHLTVDGGFQQVILRDPPSGGAQALFYASPPAIAAGDYQLTGSFKWSVFIHEAAHNFQLNSPADFCFGCKVDGRGGYYLWEGVARIFQCAAACELINGGDRYGLGQELSSDIGQSTIDMLKEIRGHYEDYLRTGMPFRSYEDPATSERETYDTFCTLATLFVLHAEEEDFGYRVPVKRMMKLLQTWDQAAFDKYDSKHDTPEASAFRSTFMVAALSFAFRQDLRPEFRALNFPITDADYEDLWQKADTDPADFSLSVTPASLTVPMGGTATCTIGIVPLGGLTHAVELRSRMTAPMAGVSLALSDKTVEPGGTTTLVVTADPGAQPSSSSIRLRAAGEYTAHGADLAVTVISVPMISAATFDGKKSLVMQGSWFGTSPRVVINGADRTSRITSATDTAIALKGKKTKLGLHKGDNKLQVIDSAGTSSSEFILRL